jgi:uncharacterized protein (UPF0218 family)
MAKAVFNLPHPKVAVAALTTGAAFLPALEGEWFVQEVHEDVDLADITAFGSAVTQHLRHREITMVLKLADARPVSQAEIGRKEEERRVEYALREQPPEIQKTIEALFQIEEGLPPDREAVVEVETGEDGKPKFTVTTRANPNPPPEPQVRDWYKRWKGKR